MDGSVLSSVKRMSEQFVGGAFSEPGSGMERTG